MTLDAQRERAESNLAYWQSVQAATLNATQREFIRRRIQSLEGEVFEKREAFSRARESARITEVDDSAVGEVQVARVRAEAAAQGLLNSEHYWAGPTYLSPFLTAEYILTLKYLGRLDTTTAEKAAHYLMRIQKSDGSFGAWDTGATDATITHGAMTALRAIGTPAALEASRRAQAWIVANKAQGQTLFTVKLLSGLLGYEKFEFTPQALKLDWIWNVPKYGLSRWSSWIRSLAAPLAIVIGTENAPGKRLPHLILLQRHQLSQLTQLLVSMTDANGQLYISETTNIMGVLAYNSLTKNHYGDYSKQVEAGLAFIRKNLIEESDTELLVKNPPSVNWDTPNMLLGILGDRPTGTRDDQYRDTFNFLYSTQVRDVYGEWARRSPRVPPGGWGTLPENHKNTDTDGTAQVLAALRLTGRNDAWGAYQHILGMNWLLGLQGPEGGWATFEKNVTPKHPGPMQFKFPTDRVDELKSIHWYQPLKLAMHAFRLLNDVQNDMVLLVDYPFSDITGHVVEGLSSFGMSEKDPEIAKALSFIKNDLGDKPVWFSRYGIDYFWGTEAAVRAFSVAGANMQQDFIQRAVDWVAAHQNADGGWGQSWESLADFRFAGTSKVSLPSTTAQALMTLLAAGRALSPEAKRAAEFLAKSQDPNSGRWIESEPNCWAGGIYAVNYTYLPQYLSMIALGRYEAEIERARTLSH